MPGRPRLKPLALTMGEPGGVGPDIAVKSWIERRQRNLPPFLWLGDPDLLAARARRFGAALPLAPAEPEDAAAVFETALPVRPLADPVPDAPGEARPESAAAVIASIREAVALTMAGRTAAVVTSPIQKAALYASGFGFPGHTEFLAALAAQDGAPRPRPVMMLAADELRVVPVTIHVPLREVPARLTRELIVETAAIVAADLRRRFAFASPRLAVAGLNPHAGEAGTLGREDEEVVRPAVERLRELGIDAAGPFPADTMFHAAARARYDAALCMYHDQALIPIKTLAFDRAVNVTLGLPFVRTSPDHGTALDIAGTGRADCGSLAAALRLADRLAAPQEAGP